MSFLSSIASLYRALVLAVSLMHKMCRMVDRMDAAVQRSNATATLKTSSTNLKTAVHLFCDQLAEHKLDLKDGIVGNLQPENP